MSNKNELLPGFVELLEESSQTSDDQPKIDSKNILPIHELPKIQELNVKNEKDREKAATALSNGQVILIQLPTLGLMVDASDPDKVANAFEIKGTPREKRKIITLAIDDLDMVARLIDIERVHPSVRKYFDRNAPEYPENKDELGRRLGGINIVRVPIYSNGLSQNKPGSEAKINGVPLHDRIISQDKNNQLWIQFLYFGNYNRSAQALVRTANDKTGITGLTSINATGKETITDLDEALKFANSKGVTTAITDPTVQGGLDTRIQSYPIIVFNQKGLEITRSENMNLDEKIVMSLWPELFKDMPLPEYLHDTPPPLWRYILSDPDRSENVIKKFNVLKQRIPEMSN